MAVVLTDDLGDNIHGWAAKIDGSIVCVATTRIEHDPEARRQVRALVTAAGGNCGTCRGCPIGREVA